MKIFLEARKLAALALFTGNDPFRPMLSRIELQKATPAQMEGGRLPTYQDKEAAYIATATDGTVALRVRLWVYSPSDDPSTDLLNLFYLCPDKAFISACGAATAGLVELASETAFTCHAIVRWIVRDNRGRVSKRGTISTGEGDWPDVDRVFPRSAERGAQGAFIAPALMTKIAKAAGYLDAGGVRIDGKDINYGQYISFGSVPDAFGLVMPIALNKEPRPPQEHQFRSPKRYKEALAEHGRRMAAYEAAKGCCSTEHSYRPAWGFRHD